MKIAIVVGHNERAQGAVSVDGTSEFTRNSRLAEMIRDHDAREVGIFFRTPGGGYSREIDRVYASVNEANPKCSIELHFNGGPPRARGAETLSSGTRKSMLLAREVHSRYVRVMDNGDRGIKARARHERGGRSLWQGRAPAILTEPFFGSNAEDWRRANARMDQLAEAIYRGAMAFINSKE